MFENPAFDANGEKLLCERNGKNADMLMTIKVKRLEKGCSITVFSDTDETAFLLLKGSVKFRWNGNERAGARKNPFELKPYCLHVCRKTEVTVEAEETSEFIIQQTDNDNDFDSVFYAPEDTLYQEFGLGQWDGAGHRICSTVFDYDNAPYSNMVLGEVFNQPGKWSSYPPHHHPQPEIYYYKFDKPQGFGACYIGDDVYKSVEGSAAFITDGNDHQQAVAPGYEMCYVWMVRHLDNDPWYKTSRFYADEHKWLVDAK